MREGERNVGRADHNLAGARSAAEGEVEQVEKVMDPDAVERSERSGQAAQGAQAPHATQGSEGGDSTTNERHAQQRKNNA
jgi:hypothetical protein